MIACIVLVNRRTKYILDCIYSMRMSGTDTKIALYNVGNDREVANICFGLHKGGYIDHLFMSDKWPALFNSFYHGMNFMRHRYNADVTLLSADDYHYEAGWGARVEEFLRGNDSVGICSCEMEPLFPWNTPLEIVENNGVKALVRNSIPGANWAFTRKMHDMVMEPQIRIHQDSLTLDHTVGAHVRDNLGLKLCALPLAYHVGAYESEVGNMAFQVNARPLPDEWQI